MIEIFINFNFKIMKQTIKFVVAVFGVTVATFGTLSSKARIQCFGSTGCCATIKKFDGTTIDYPGSRSQPAPRQDE